MEFLYYESGILLSKIGFEEKNTVHLNKIDNLASIQITDLKIPIKTVEQILREAKDVNWDSHSNVKLESGYQFWRFKQVSENGWNYAMPNSKEPIDLIIYNNGIVAFLFHKGVDSAILVKPGYEALTPIILWNDPLISKADYGIEHKGKVQVKMRDGIHLATELWLPKDLQIGGGIPTILIRTPYGRLTHGLEKLRFVQRGFALVSQDVRGREDSEGEWMPMYHEIQDGDDTLNWIASQSWSNGNIGMVGSSYGGFVQWAAAASGNPHLKAIISIVTAGSPFGDLPRKNGFYSSGLMAWIFMMAKRKMNRNALIRNDWEDVLNIRPIRDIPKKALDEDIYFWNEWMKHPNYDAFWANFDWTKHREQINVPALYISGWYDDDGMGTTEAWELNQSQGRKHQKLILGPWYHSANSTREIHNIQFGLDAIRYDLNVICQRWYDRFLKGIENGIDKESPVEYYTVAANKWDSAKKWPPENMNLTNFYIHSNGNANTSLGDGTLNIFVPNNEMADQYEYDPKNPTPYLIDVSENECSVPENYCEVEKRNDVLVYTTEPLEGDIEIAGDVYAVLYASSSALDTDWVVRLTDVDEHENSIRLSDGMIRARYRYSYEQPAFLDPHKIEKYEIKMSNIANQFKKGHRIRIAITSGAKNAVFPNQNTGNNPTFDMEFIVAQQTIYHQQKYPSCIKLPIIKTNQM